MLVLPLLKLLVAELELVAGLGLLERRNGRVHGVVLRCERRRIGRELRVQLGLLGRHVAQARLQTLIDRGQQAAGLRVLGHQSVDLRRNTVRAAEQRADGGQT